MSGEGHPFMLIMSFLVVLDTSALKISLELKRFGLALFFVYNFYFMWTVAVILIYSDSLPSGLTAQKFYFEWQVILPYIYVMVFPVHRFNVCFAVMTPLLICSAYFQSKGEAAAM